MRRLWFVHMRSAWLRYAGFGLAVAAAIVAAAGGAAHAEYQESGRQREACKPDVYRLCKWYIPSRSGITYCLYQNIDRLSPGCRAVMEGRMR